MNEIPASPWPQKVYEQPLIIDGQFEAYTMSRLPLRDLVPGELTCVYFDTASGNTYAVWYPNMIEGDDRLAMIGLEGNRGKGRSASAYYFTDQEVQQVVLELAKQFRYGRGGRTTMVTEITFLTGRLGQPNRDALPSDVRSRFWGEINRGRS